MILPLLLLTILAQDVVVTGPGRANAQTPATMVLEPAAMFIVACDGDGDARTTRAELQACIARTLGKDPAPMGYLAYADWQQRWLGDQGALPSPFEVDRDGDGRITPAEIQAQFGKLFNRYDKDGDSAVTRAEALTIRATAAGAKGPTDARGRRGGKPDRPRGERVPGGTPDPRPSPLR